MCCYGLQAILENIAHDNYKYTNTTQKNIFIIIISCLCSASGVRLTNLVIVRNVIYDVLKHRDVFKNNNTIRLYTTTYNKISCPADKSITPYRLYVQKPFSDNIIRAYSKTVLCTQFSLSPMCRHLQNTVFDLVCIVRNDFVTVTCTMKTNPQNGKVAELYFTAPMLSYASPD